MGDFENEKKKPNKQTKQKTKIQQQITCTQGRSAALVLAKYN